VVHAASGEAALERSAEEPFALVILDLMLPGIDGLEVCRRLRRQDPRLPILILTARAQEEDRIKGLAEGADDYLAKPFSLDEFLLRVKGMLRRSSWYRPENAEERYAFGPNEVDLRERRAVTSRGEIVLTELEVRMLRTFFRREGEVLSRAELLHSVWGVSPETETRTLDNFIVRLRKYFEPDPARPAHFLTVRSRGYRFVRGEGR
jgi:DNA-binding response OmpR family regulator